MTCKIVGTGFAFGEISPPTIPGFAIIARRGHWLTARDLAGTEYIPEKVSFGWRLHPVIPMKINGTHIDTRRTIPVMTHALPAPA